MTAAKRRKKRWRLVHPERLLLAVLLLLFAAAGIYALVQAVRKDPVPQESVQEMREESAIIEADSRKGTLSLDSLLNQLRGMSIAMMDLNRENYEKDPSLPPEKARQAVGYSYCLVIAPGHGGADGGNVKGGLPEKTINLAVALAVRDYIESHCTDIKVVMTRTTDVLVNYAGQYAVANENEADFALSIHCNSYGGSGRACGTEALYFSKGADDVVGARSKEAAAKLSTVVSAILNADDRGAKFDSSTDIMKDYSMPAALVELGFLSDASDNALLCNEAVQKQIGEAIGQLMIDILHSYPVKGQAEVIE